MRKTIFVDFDDTLCLHLYRNKVDKHIFDEIPEACDYFYNECELNVPLYSYLAREQENCDVILLSSASSKMLDIKKFWLDKYCPKLKFKDYIAVSIDINKSQIMLAYSQKFDVPIGDIVFIDDSRDERWSAESEGFCTFNPQLLMNAEYKSKN